MLQFLQVRWDVVISTRTLRWTVFKIASVKGQECINILKSEELLIPRLMNVLIIPEGKWSPCTHTYIVSLLCPLIHINLFEVSTFESKVFRDPFVAIVKYQYVVIICSFSSSPVILMLECSFKIQIILIYRTKLYKYN